MAELGRKWRRRGDLTALVLLLAVFTLGLGSYGLAAPGMLREIAFALCGLLGLWVFLALAENRWRSRPLLTPAAALVAALLLWPLIQLTPLPENLAGWISPLLGESLKLQAELGLEPGWAPLALNPARGWNAWRAGFAIAMVFLCSLMMAQKRQWFLALAVIVAGFSLLEGITGLLRMIFLQQFRGSGFIFSASHHAAAILMGLPIALALLTHAAERQEGGLRQVLSGGHPLLLGYLAVVLAAAGWLMAFSRGSLILGSLPVFVWVAWELLAARRGEKPGPAMLAVLTAGLLAAVIGLALLLSPAADRLTTLNSADRLAIWSALARALPRVWLFGAGPEGTEHLINRFAEFPVTSAPIYAHNDWLQWVADYGAAGLLVVAAPMIRMISTALRTLPPVSATLRKLQRAAFAGLCGALLHALTDFHLRVPLIGITAAILAALLLQRTWKQEERAEEQPSAL